MADYLIPILIIALFLYSFYKKVNVYNSFLKGAKESVGIAVGLFPCLAAIFIALALMKASGLDNLLSNLLAPIFVFLGIPVELVKLVILRPFSGGGSIAILTDVLKSFGCDSYIGRCACVILGSSDTVFYISSIYFSDTKVKNLGFAIPIALVCTLFSSIVSCLICKLF